MKNLMNVSLTRYIGTTAYFMIECSYFMWWQSWY